MSSICWIQWWGFVVFSVLTVFAVVVLNIKLGVPLVKLPFDGDGLQHVVSISCFM